MSNEKQLYAQHIQILQDRTRNAITRDNLDGLIIHSGQLSYQFLDDNPYPFKPNPHFKQWLPVTDNPNSWLIVDGVNKPKLIFYHPVDFWHFVPEEPSDFWADFFDIVLLKHANSVEKHLPYDRAKYAYIGEHIEVAQALGIDQVNPDKPLNYLHYERAFKTDYELNCMRRANQLAVAGHKAAAKAFFSGQSEFEINQSYLLACQQGDNDVPYGNIVALNKNASILHYTVLEREVPAEHLSFLIDAGANYRGYAADITRTYCTKRGIFSDLINAIDTLTINTVDQLKPGVNYVDVHKFAYHGVAQILSNVGIINLSAEDMLQHNIVGTFFPHGTGHFLGLQVHDVGGHFADDRGTPNPAPSEHPFLRCTRQVEPNQVFTIEPGLYFIDSLLADLKTRPESKFVNWQLIDELKPFGGIRIEDDVIVHRSKNENMSRDYWQE